MKLNRTFRSWDKLNQAILLNSQARIARAWYALRCEDVEGKGWLFKDSAQSAIRFYLHISPRVAQGLLRSGEGLLWKKRGGVILLRSQAKIAAHFGVRLGLAVDLPISCLSRLRKFKANLYASYFAGKPRTISLAIMHELFGASRSTLKSWARLAGVKSEAQFGFIQKRDERTPLVWREGGVWERDNDGESETFWQLANRYTVPKLEANKKMQSNDGCPYYRHRATYLRLYFTRVSALTRQLRGAIPGEICYLSTLRNDVFGRWYALVAV